MSVNTEQLSQEQIDRRGRIACAREYHAPRPVTHEEASQVDAFTIGERVNFKLIAAICGPQYAEDWKALLGL